MEDWPKQGSSPSAAFASSPVTSSVPLFGFRHGILRHASLSAVKSAKWEPARAVVSMLVDCRGSVAAVALRGDGSFNSIAWPCMLPSITAAPIYKIAANSVTTQSNLATGSLLP